MRLAVNAKPVNSLRRAEKELSPVVSRREWLLALLVAVVLAALLTVPYVLGYSLAGDDKVYTGLLMNPEDSQSYFAKMLQGFHGSWLYTINFTPEEHDPAFLGGFYLALGHLARVLHVSVETVWHSARLAGGVLLFITTFGFGAYFLRQSEARWTAYLLASVGSGLGWLLLLLNQRNWLGAFPVDFKMPESHLFFTALTFPHVSAGTTLLLVEFWLLLRTSESGHGRWKYAVLAGMINLALAVLYPFIILLVLATITLYWLYRTINAGRVLWHSAALYGIALLVPAPLYLYYANTLLVNDVFRSWSDQAVTQSPPWPHYLVSFGPMLLLGATLFLRNSEHRDHRFPLAFLWIWVLSAALLLYAPVNPQRRYVQGLQEPLSLLATAGLLCVLIPALEQTQAFRWLVSKPRYTIRGMRRLIVFAFLALMGLSNLYLMVDLSFTMAVKQPYPFFRATEEMAALDWVKSYAEPSAIVMGAYETGSLVAARAGNPVFIGHWAETFEWQQKYNEMNRFYGQGATDNWRRELLSRYGVGIVWYGPKERSIGAFRPDGVDYLRPVYDNGSVTLYEVR